MLEISVCAQGSLISVRATPGAKRDSVGGEHAGALKVAVTAPPDKGKANEAVVALLADKLGLARSAVELVSGQTARHKKFRLHGLTPAQVTERLEA